MLTLSGVCSQSSSANAVKTAGPLVDEDASLLECREQGLGGVFVGGSVGGRCYGLVVGVGRTQHLARKGGGFGRAGPRGGRGGLPDDGAADALDRGDAFDRAGVPGPIGVPGPTRGLVRGGGVVRGGGLGPTESLGGAGVLDPTAVLAPPASSARPVPPSAQYGQRGCGSSGSVSTSRESRSWTTIW